MFILDSGLSNIGTLKAFLMSAASVKSLKQFVETCIFFCLYSNLFKAPNVFFTYLGQVYLVNAGQK